MLDLIHHDWRKRIRRLSNIGHLVDRDVWLDIGDVGLDRSGLLNSSSSRRRTMLRRNVDRNVRGNVLVEREGVLILNLLGLLLVDARLVIGGDHLRL